MRHLFDGEVQVKKFTTALFKLGVLDMHSWMNVRAIIRATRKWVWYD